MQKQFMYLLTLVFLLATARTQAQTEFILEGLRYCITDETNQKVEVAGYDEENAPTSVSIPATVTHENTSYRVTGIGEGAFHRCYPLQSINIGEGVEQIGDLAFQYCSKLPVVNLPASVKNIGVNPFYGCSELTQINVAENNSSYCSIDGVLFDREKKILVAYPSGREGSYTIPEGVTHMNDYAFIYCLHLTDATLPASMTDLGNGAFCSCPELKQLNVYAPIPPQVGPGSFFPYGDTNEDYFDAVVCVPATSLKDYQSADIWKELNLQALPDMSGIKEVELPQSIRLTGKQLINPEELEVEVYSTDGHKIYSGTQATVEMPAGTYVIRCGNATAKAIFRQ